MASASGGADDVDGGDPDKRGAGMAGVLFQYKGKAGNLQAFESGPPRARRKLVMLGGLSDGMLACPYVPALAEALAAEGEGWSVVQPNLRSSYMQWGFGSLAADVEDVTSLIDALVAGRGAESVAICGHSTGSQIIAHLMRTRPHPAVTHVILQGGVSDRESDDAEETAKRAATLELAHATAAASPSGRQEMLPRGTTWAPVTAQRYTDLNAHAGADDYFSSDLTVAQLAERFSGHYDTTNVMIAYSGSDEYVPPSVDKPALLRRLRAAMQGAGPAGAARGAVVVPVLVEGGDHALYAKAGAQQFVGAVVAFLNGRPVQSALA